MRYELTDHEWFAIQPLLPNKPRGVPRVDDRCTLNAIFWVLRSGAPWRDLPSSLGPYTTSYNRFVRWRRAGVWSRNTVSPLILKLSLFLMTAVTTHLVMSFGQTLFWHVRHAAVPVRR